MKPIPKAMVLPTSAVRVLSLMLLLSVALTARPFTVDGLNYSVSNGVATLTGATSRDITSLTIPATVTYGGTTYPVNAIHRKAFDNYTSLRKVHIAASDQPILCDQVQKFGMDSYFEADSPFDNCPIDEFIIERDHYTALSNGSVKDDNVFLNTSSDNVSLSYTGKVKSIIGSTINFKFFKPTQVTSVTIGCDSIKYFSNSAFNKCTNINKISLLPGEYTIPSGAFPSGLALDSLYLGKVCKSYPLSFYPAHVVFGEGWTSIPQGFFHSTYYDNTSLQTVSLPEGLREIEGVAFIRCRNLSTINFPKSLKKIGQSAFNECVQLKDVTFNEGLDSIGSSAFYKCESFTRLKFPASLKVIDGSAFSGANNVKSIFFEKSADNAPVEIKENAIPLSVDSLVLNRPVNSRGGCLSAHVVFGEGWTSIPQGFFHSTYYDNTSLQTVSLPEGLREIEGVAFLRCRNLSSINFPKSLKKIGSSAFDGCEQLMDVQTAATEPPVCDGSNVFGTKTYNDGTLTVPAGRKKTYRSAEVWKLFKNVQSEGGGFKVTVAYDSQYGQVTLNGSDATEIAVDEDEPLTVAITPAEGYRVTRLSINGEDKTASLIDNRLAFESIDTNMAFEVEFGIITYTLTLPDATAGGHISVNGLAEATTSIDYGARLELTAVADRGYKLDAMTVNGADVTALLDQSFTYVIEHVTENVEVTAAFSPITYTITAVNTTAKYGELTLNGQTGNCTVEFGNPLAIDVAPNEGCYLVRLTVDGVDVTDSVADGKYTVETVEADMTVEAVFAIHTYTIDLNFDSSRGTILFDRQGNGTTVTVEHGDELRLTIVPAEGYETAAVSLDGKDVTGQLDEYGVLTLANISSDHTVAATFDIKRVRLNVLGLEGGRIAMRYDYGTEVTLFIEPEDGWEFHSLTVGDMTITELEADGSYTTPALTDHTDVSVVFKLKGQGGIDNAADRQPLTVSARQRTVTVEGADEGALVEIFDTAGMTVYRGTEHVITLNRQGVHIVRVSGLTFKVMLR